MACVAHAAHDVVVPAVYDLVLDDVVDLAAEREGGDGLGDRVEEDVLVHELGGARVGVLVDLHAEDHVVDVDDARVGDADAALQDLAGGDAPERGGDLERLFEDGVRLLGMAVDIGLEQELTVVVELEHRLPQAHDLDRDQLLLLALLLLLLLLLRGLLN